MFGHVKTAKWASGSTMLERMFADIITCPGEGDEVEKCRVQEAKDLAIPMT